MLMNNYLEIEITKNNIVYILAATGQSGSPVVIQKAAVDLVAALATETGFLKSNGEARRAVKENAISVNKTKISETYLLTHKDLIADRYILLQRGKKNYYLLKIEN